MGELRDSWKCNVVDPLQISCIKCALAVQILELKAFKLRHSEVEISVECEDGSFLNDHGPTGEHPSILFVTTV